MYNYGYIIFVDQDGEDACKNDLLAVACMVNSVDTLCCDECVDNVL